MSSLIDIISKELIIANTKKARERVVSPDGRAYSEKAQQVWQKIIDEDLDNTISDGLQRALYNIVGAILDEPLPPLPNGDETGEYPASYTMVCMLDDDSGHDFGVSVPFIYLGGDDNQGLKSNGEIEDDVDQSPHWRYASDTETVDFFRSSAQE
jgi:hypothetical protein